MTPPTPVTEEEAWIAEVSASWQAAPLRVSPKSLAPAAPMRVDWQNAHVACTDLLKGCVVRQIHGVGLLSSGALVRACWRGLLGQRGGQWHV